MSIRIMTNVWASAPHKRERLLVLLALADFADDDGVCWPSLDTIAAKARVTKSGAIGIVQALEAAGEIVVERGGGRGRSNRYRLVAYAETVASSDPFSGDETVDDDGVKGRREVVKGRPSSTRSVNRTVSTEPDDVLAVVLAKPTDWSEEARAVYRRSFAQARRADQDAFARYVDEQADPEATLAEWQAFRVECVESGEWGKYVTSRTAVERFDGWRAGRQSGPLDLDAAW